MAMRMRCWSGCALVERSVEEVIAASGVWTRLAMAPVRSIEAVAALGEDGTATALAAGAYRIDVDAHGCGWVRAGAPGVRRVRVKYLAGLAGAPEAVPEALRQGTARLAAHLYMHRGEADGSGPPAAVTALWRPWRRMRL